MAMMTREMARFLIVTALAEVRPAEIRRGGTLGVFHAAGLATDDDVTTWADVFLAADLADWERKASSAADEAAFLSDAAGGAR